MHSASILRVSGALCLRKKDAFGSLQQLADCSIVLLKGSQSGRAALNKLYEKGHDSYLPFCLQVWQMAENIYEDDFNAVVK